MAVIDILIQPHGCTRVLFDCRKTKARLDDERSIERAIERSFAAAGTDDKLQAD
jgi:hypothetical protein